MDQLTTIDVLKKKTGDFTRVRDWDQFHNAKELATAVSIEANELLDHFRFKTHEQVDALFKDPKRKEAITEEMVDVLFFLLRIADRYNIDMASTFDKKLLKNAAKYPIDLVKGKNHKYDEY